jgi:hydroxyacylglutathione hydrolase
VAAALLDRHDHHVILVDDDFDNADKLGITGSS